MCLSYSWGCYFIYCVAVKEEKDTELQLQQSVSDKYVKQNSDYIKENNVSVKLNFSEVISG